jgi:hypothetical protein
MPYREDRAALETRCATLERELGSLRARTKELDALKRAETDVARELAETRRLLGAVDAKKKSLPLLERARIATPCKANWDDMVGDERVRFCGDCGQNVYNLESMTSGEATDLLEELEGDVCVRIFRRRDGTILTSDCPVGVRNRRVGRAVGVAVGAGMLAVGGALMTMTDTNLPVASGAANAAHASRNDRAELVHDPEPVVTQELGRMVSPR